MWSIGDIGTNSACAQWLPPRLAHRLPLASRRRVLPVPAWELTDASVEERLPSPRRAGQPNPIRTQNTLPVHGSFIGQPDLCLASLDLWIRGGINCSGEDVGEGEGEGEEDLGRWFYQVMRG